ncbi:50S ribosomal protein L10 [[Eubacterium] cellulosolvens]
MAHIAQWKEAEVTALEELIEAKPVIGIVNVKGIPGPQIQKMRQSLYGKAILRISKIKLLMIALEELESKKDGIIDLIHSLEGQIGLIATDMNPFKLFQLLETSKRPAPVKAGETVPEDIEVKAGETAFKPGPIVGELQRVGIPAAIEQGKVVIKADKILVKAGETVSAELAQMLTRLEIYPMTVGLDLQSVYENGVIFDKSQLDVDPQKFIDNMRFGASAAFNLAYNINYVTSATIYPLLQSAHSQALNLLFNSNMITPETINFMLAKGTNQMLSLGSRLSSEALDDELKERLGGVAAETAFAEEPAAAKEPKPKAKADSEEKESKDKGKDKKEEKEVSEEEAASGLSQLFG